MKTERLGSGVDMPESSLEVSRDFFSDFQYRQKESSYHYGSKNIHHFRQNQFSIVHISNSKNRIASKTALGEIAFVREFSQSLAEGWSQVGGMVETILEETTDLQKVRVNTPAGTAGRRFVRLRVTRR